MRGKGLFLSIILAVFLSNNAYSAELLSLDEALSIAKENNPKVTEARKNVKIAQNQYKISRKWENPEVEVEVGNLAKDLDGDSNFSTRNIESEIRITQPMDGWGKKGLKRQIAKNELEQQETALKNVWLNTVKQVKEQYTQTLLSKKATELAQENLELNQKFLDQTQIKFDSGNTVNHQLSRAKLEVINARNLVLSAHKDHVINQGKLNLLLGQPLTTDYELIDSFQTENLDQSYEELLKMALRERADVSIQENTLDTKDKELILAKRDRLPSYDLSFFVEREDEIYKGGVGVAFELPIWNLNGNKIQQAKLEKEKVKEMLRNLKNEVALEVYTSFHEADLAQKSHDISIEAMKEANEILRFTTMGYEEGDVSFLSYLENLKAYQETKMEFFESLSDYTIKIAELEQVVGRPHKSEE